MPRLSPCGSRNATYGDFETKHALASRKKDDAYIAMLVDSEDPVAGLEEPWVHLSRRDGWERPAGAKDEQVLLMTTCMETWIVADRATLKAHYGQHLQQSALPALQNLEKQNRHDVQDKLVHATRKCSNAYAKGKRSFEVLAELDPVVLKEHLPSFARVERILNEKL